MKPLSSDRDPGSRISLLTLDPQPPEDTPMASPPRFTDTGSPNPRTTASTAKELLELEGYTISDVVACRTDEGLIKVVKDPALQCWKITRGEVEGKRVYSLIALKKKLSDKIIEAEKVKASWKKRAQEEDAAAGEGDAAGWKGKGKAAAPVSAGYIVDRPEDPGYRDWVAKMVKPQVRGSRLLRSDPPEPEEDTCPFWWMSKEWKREYWEDASLGRLAKNQAAVSASAVSCFLSLGAWRVELVS